MECAILFGMKKRQIAVVTDESRVVLFVINTQDTTVLKMKVGLESQLQADGIRLQVVSVPKETPPSPALRRRS